MPPRTRAGNRGFQDYHQEKTMSRMFNPPHPGATLREDILPALSLTVTDAAPQLGGGRAEIWLGMQMDYDLWMAEQGPAPLVERAPESLAA